MYARTRLLELEVTLIFKASAFCGTKNYSLSLFHSLCLSIFLSIFCPNLHTRCMQDNRVMKREKKSTLRTLEAFVRFVGTTTLYFKQVLFSHMIRSRILRVTFFQRRNKKNENAAKFRNRVRCFGFFDDMSITVKGYIE